MAEGGASFQRKKSLSEHFEMNADGRNNPKPTARNRKPEILTTVRRTPKSLDAGDLDTPLNIGSVVELELGGSPKPVRGVVRWIGYYDSPNKPIAGVELDEENPAGTSGVYMKTKLFHCNPKRAMFPYLYRCKIVKNKENRKKQAQTADRMRFHATFGDNKKLIQAEGDTFSVQDAVRLAFHIPDDVQLLLQVWHQEEECEEWVDLDQEYLRIHSKHALKKLNVLVQSETIGDKEIEEMNTDLARSMVNAFNFDHVSDEYLF